MKLWTYEASAMKINYVHISWLVVLTILKNIINHLETNINHYSSLTKLLKLGIFHGFHISIQYKKTSVNYRRTAGSVPWLPQILIPVPWRDWKLVPSPLVFVRYFSTEPVREIGVIHLAIFWFKGAPLVVS